MVIESKNNNQEIDTIENKGMKTAKDFKEIPEGSFCQLINGDIIMSSPSPSFLHQDLLWELGSLMRRFVKEKKLGFVIGSPIDVYFSDTEVYQPDLIFISNEQSPIIRDAINGAPDLIVEILSPSNAYYDLSHKKYTYETFGVKEYWIVDPQEKSIEIFENNNEFVLASRARLNGKVSSKLLQGFSINLEEYFHIK